MKKRLKKGAELRRNFLGIRWSDEELNIVATAAHDRWLSVSPFVRQLVMDALVKETKGSK